MKKREKKFVEYMMQTLENKYCGGYNMKYVEVTIEEALKRCNKNTKVLVAIQNLEEDDIDIVFALRQKETYGEIFEDVKTVASICDDFMNQLRLFTEKQDIYNVKPRGLQKTVLLKQ